MIGDVLWRPPADVLQTAEIGRCVTWLREAYTYVYDELGADVLLINGSGGTDVCSGIVSPG
jgi:hypothetical protein